MCGCACASGRIVGALTASSASQCPSFTSSSRAASHARRRTNPVTAGRIPSDPTGRSGRGLATAPRCSGPALFRSSASLLPERVYAASSGRLGQGGSQTSSRSMMGSCGSTSSERGRSSLARLRLYGTSNSGLAIGSSSDAGRMPPVGARRRSISIPLHRRVGSQSKSRRGDRGGPSGNHSSESMVPLRASSFCSCSDHMSACA
jgi:hypothetical protein